MQKILLYPGKILSARTAGKNPEKISKTEKFSGLRNLTPSGSISNFFEIFSA